MEDRQIRRVILLIIAGLLLISTSLFWVLGRKQSQELNLKDMMKAVNPVRSDRLSNNLYKSKNRAFIARRLAKAEALNSANPSPVTTSNTAGLIAEPEAHNDPLLAQITGKRLPATSLKSAEALAKASSGKTDPFDSIQNNDQTSANEKVVAKDSSKTKKSGFVPPPPPTLPSIANSESQAGNNGLDSGLSIDELPLPPARQALADKMKLIAIIGDRAMLEFTDKSLAQHNKWPNLVTLGPGDQFENMNIVSVDQNSITIEEDGERGVKVIDPVKGAYDLQ